MEYFTEVANPSPEAGAVSVYERRYFAYPNAFGGKAGTDPNVLISDRSTLQLFIFSPTATDVPKGVNPKIHSIEQGLQDQVDGALKSRHRDFPTPVNGTVEIAREIIQTLLRRKLAPTSVQASCEGGIGLTFVKGNRVVYVEVLNKKRYGRQTMWGGMSESDSIADMLAVDLASPRSAVEFVKKHVG